MISEMMKRINGHFVIIVMAIFWCCSGIGYGATLNFDGEVDSDWNTASNWDADTVPLPADTARLGTGFLSPAIVDVNADTQVRNIQMGFWHSYYGYKYKAVLNINNGAVLTARSVELGRDPGSTGIVNIASGATLLGESGVNTYIYVGNDTGAVSSLSVTCGVATAIMNVDGYVNWTNGIGTLDVGNYGPGTLNINSAGAVDTHNLYVGVQQGAPGTVNIANGGILKAKQPYIGDKADGELTINAGGQILPLDINPFLNIAGRNTGSSVDATGRVTVAGTIDWTYSGSTYGQQINVGNYGHGILDITNNGSITCGTVVIGQQASSEGTLIVENHATLITTNITFCFNDNTNNEHVLQLIGTNASIVVRKNISVRRDAIASVYEPHIDGNMNFVVDTIASGKQLTIRPTIIYGLTNGTYTVMAFVHRYTSDIVLDDNTGFWTMDYGAASNDKITLTFSGAAKQGTCVKIY